MHPPVRLDDGAADRHAQAGRLRRLERFEDTLRHIGVDADARVFDADQGIALLLSREDEQVARPLLDGAHRLDGIDYQVQEDLLDLNAITDRIQTTLPWGVGGKRS